MPLDKWGIPFFYPTKKTAGISGGGTGFYWTQNNDIHKDDDYEGTCMLRLGKEHDSSSLKVINSTTGEWQFPFTYAYSYSPSMSLSGPTGHHSGGETHGCQGFTYMINCEFDSNPPKFRFRKETYHVQYDNDPVSGVWTSPFATGPVDNVWKGVGWVRYNKKDGRGPGKDSVICEAWWCDDPINHLADGWKKIGTTEDKGKGFNNWGVPATCDGEDYQVGTWSAIQFRFKSSGSDFSLHPRKPECDAGSNIEAIGGENMSFSDSEARGYSYRNDMPRDIEMKCLFKWNGGGQGIARFKNISIREIDPSLSFDDIPTGGTGGGDPGPVTTSEVIGSLTIKRDVNALRTSPCSSAGASYGSLFYDSPLDASGNDWAFPHGDTAINKTRIGILCNSSSSTIANKPPIKQAEFYMKKTGSPTGTATCKIRGQATDKATIGTLDVSTLTTSSVLTTFTNTSNTYVLVPSDRIIVEYTGGDASNYVSMKVNETLNITNGTYTQASYFNSITGDWVQSTTHEVAGKLWG